MPKVDGVGYSNSTYLKIEDLSRIFAMHLAITKAVLVKHGNLYQQRYRYIDLTAGKGFTPNGLRGSPLIFLEQVESDKVKIPYRADLIECKEKNINELKLAILTEANKLDWKGGEIEYHLGRYQSVIPSLLNEKCTNEMGLFFVDPSGDLPDFDILGLIADLRPRMEILIYVSSTNIKRLYKHQEKRLTDYLEKVSKQHWLIRQPISWDQFKWTILLGSNSSLFRDYKKINFLRLESEGGQKILEKLNLTKIEQMERHQLKLFE